MPYCASCHRMFYTDFPNEILCPNCNPNPVSDERNFVDSVIHGVKTVIGLELTDSDVNRIKYCQSSNQAHLNAEIAETQAKSAAGDADDLNLGTSDYEIPDYGDRFISAYNYNLSSTWDRRAEELERQEEEEEYNRNPAKPYIEAWEEENNRKTTLNGIYKELNRQGYNFNSVDEYMKDNYGNYGDYGDNDNCDDDGNYGDAGDNDNCYDDGNYGGDNDNYEEDD